MKRSRLRPCFAAAGVRAPISVAPWAVPVDSAGRVITRPDLTIEGHPEVFVIGDMSSHAGANGRPLPGIALVAMQEGIYAADIIKKEVRNGPQIPRPRSNMRTGDRWRRSVAAAPSPNFVAWKLSGVPAWWFWLIVHIYRT